MTVTKQEHERLTSTPTKTQRARRDDDSEIEEILRAESELWDLGSYRPIFN